MNQVLSHKQDLPVLCGVCETIETTNFVLLEAFSLGLSKTIEERSQSEAGSRLVFAEKNSWLSFCLEDVNGS